MQASHGSEGGRELKGDLFEVLIGEAAKTGGGILRVQQGSGSHHASKKKRSNQSVFHRASQKICNSRSDNYAGTAVSASWSSSIRISISTSSGFMPVSGYFSTPCGVNCAPRLAALATSF